MRLSIGCWILFLVLLTPVRDALEKSMVLHVLLEFPLLIFAGYLFASVTNLDQVPFVRLLNRGGVAGVLIASFTLAFWMIPKWLDYSLSSEIVAWSKIFSLVFLVGFSLTMSWKYLHPIVSALIKIEFLTMLLRLGWIYLISPERLCNSYLLADQILLGKSFLALAAVLSLIWIYPLFIESKSRTGYGSLAHCNQSKA